MADVNESKHCSNYDDSFEFPFRFFYLIEFSCVSCKSDSSFKPSLNRAAVGWAVSCSAFGFFFCVGKQTQTPTADCLHRMMSSSANYRPFLSSFRHIPPQEGFVKLAN